MLSTGDVIDGKYRIVRLIGEGGMGAVYEGENVRIHRRVAIKILHAAVAADAGAVQRFEREAQAAGRIGSEHIVEVLDLGNLPDGDRYMVMEFLEGCSLSERIQERGRLTPHELYPLARQILEGLSAAHGAGIIHRDLKPDNVFLLKSRGGQADFAKLLDFGISKFNQLSGDSGFSMTRTGAVMGTPYYMSPEQAKGAKSMDHRADLYAIGVIMYEAVTGQVPFNADTFNELLFKIVLEEPPPIHEIVPEIDPAFAALITKAMAREPAHRFQAAQEFQQELDAWAQTQSGTHTQVLDPPVARPPMLSSATGTLSKGTPGAWSNSDISVVTPPAKSSKLPLLIVGALGGVVLVAALGIVLARSASSSAAATPGPSASETLVETAAPTSSEKPPEDPKTAEPPPEATSAVPPVESSAPVAENKPPPANTRVMQPRPTAKPTATATKTAPATTSTGRVIRKEL